METVAQTRISPRSPAQVMRLSRLGSLHQCRLSFMRILTRRMQRERWTFSRPVFEIDDKGVGVAVYSAHGPTRSYSLIAFAHDLPPEMRSDRVIATAWDATFTLFDGIPTREDIDRLSKNVPYQEAGRVTDSEISVSRANRSVRLWEHFVDALANGQQPDIEKVNAVGYLMRTTAVYGSGKLGAADREKTAERPETNAPFQVEMLSVFLTRAFVRDLVNFMAQSRGGDKAVALDPTIARSLGIGNSTGLGMAPYIVNHPVLFNNWITVREEAIARVRNVITATVSEANDFRAVLRQSERNVALWKSEHPIQVEKLADLRMDLDRLNAFVAGEDLINDHPWHRLMNWSEANLSEEGQELVASLILEPYAELVDGLAACLANTNTDSFHINGAMSVGELKDLLNECFGWACDVNWQERENCARAWYVSEEKLEPRLGERFEEPIAEYEQPLAPARDAAELNATLADWASDASVAELLLKHPEHRHTVRRLQVHVYAPYGEIQDNTISAEVLPIDMLRCKLSFFGATHFDPRSDRWVRICMYGGAPYPEEISRRDCDRWVYPELEAAQ